MRVIVTCGPSYEPIDCVRRLTNFSTGELGLMLAAALARGGHDVLCLRGIGATAQVATPRVEILPFSTNDDLVWKLSGFAGKADALFHTAALCDYRVESIEAEDGREIPPMGKVPTRMGSLVLRLAPTTKVLPRLRGMFPQGKLVGWKYESDGDRPSVLAKAAQQLQDCKTDACVVNGSAWGDGFGFVLPGIAPVSLPDKLALCEFLCTWVIRPASAPPPT